MTTGEHGGSGDGGANGGPKLMVVSLHDVAPPFEGDIREQVAALHELGIQRFALQVVPNWHEDDPISGNVSFVEFVRGCLDDGAEPVLHGYSHRPSGGWRGSPFRLARARVFASSAAEFMTLSGKEARRAVRLGLEEFERARVPSPETFCAPGWLLTDEAEDAVVEAGMKHLVGMVSLQDLETSRLYALPSIGYMGAGELHELGIRAMSRVFQPVIDRFERVQVYLHPDRTGRRRWASTVERVARMIEREHWEVVTYSDMPARIEASPSSEA